MNHQDKTLRTSFSKYTFQMTEDGHLTFFSHAFNESGHSSSGTRGETVHNYIQGCKIIEKLATSANLQIFEVGFGIGPGFKTTLEEIDQVYSGKTIDYCSCEIDSELARFGINNHLDVQSKKLKHTSQEITFDVETKNRYRVKIILGDIRQMSDSIPPLLDAIYQDPFSVKKNPTLWTYEWFNLLKYKSHEKTILATYSTSASVKKTLLASGWSIEERPGFGRKKTCLRAFPVYNMDLAISEELKSDKIKVMRDE